MRKKNNEIIQSYKSKTDNIDWRALGRGRHEAVEKFSKMREVESEEEDIAAVE